MNSLLNKINKDIINIVKSYLIISEYQMNKNKEVLIYNFYILAIKDEKEVNVRSFVKLFCGYCVNCDNKGYYYPICQETKYTIIFNKKVICHKCYNSYYLKFGVIKELETIFHKSKLFY